VKRPLAAFLLPALAMTLWFVAPLATGSRTLFLRDVFNTHLPMRIGLGRALRAGELPLVDPLRAGGQGLLGNPNAVPLYPDNLLLLVTSDLWQLNAHFWIHWLLAFGAMYALGRAWKLGPEASATAAVVYALSGYFLSQLNLYNAVAGAALAPALTAALLGSAERRWRRRALPMLGAIWALELLAGDPVLAGIALVSALVLAGASRRAIPWRAVALALLVGTLLAAPQWIETLRLLPGSHRGFWGQQTGGRGTPEPAALLDLILPLFFGQFDVHQFWGRAAFGDFMPLYGSLAPGLLALALTAVGLRRAQRRGWLMAAMALGIAVAYSGGVVVGWASSIPGAELFRLPVKFALLSMLATSLAAGQGLEALLAGAEARRSFGRWLLALLSVEVTLLAFFLSPGNLLETPFRNIFAVHLSDSNLEVARPGWAGLAAWQSLFLVAALVSLRSLGRRPKLTMAVLVMCHAALQLVLLRSLVATDSATPYRETPELLASVPATAVTTHGCNSNLFCRTKLVDESAPDPRVLWSTRRAYDELYSFSLLAAGRRDELHLSPEGLDAFPLAATASAIRAVDDVRGLRMLAAMGVDRLIVNRPLEPETAARAKLVSAGVGSPETRLYQIDGSLPDAVLVGRVRRAPTMNQALLSVVSPEFDPRSETVVSGSGPPLDGPGGVVGIGRWAPDEVELTVESEAGGVVVVRRAWLSIWQAAVDGATAPVRIANMNRLAVEVPPGRHTVRFFVSRMPFYSGLFAAGLGALGLLLLALRRSPLADRGTRRQEAAS